MAAKRSERPDIKLGKVEHVIDGKPYHYRLGKDGAAHEISICCDCSLVHVMRFKPLARSIQVTVWRHDELTDKFRKKVKHDRPR
jgi:hypothetical protein